MADIPTDHALVTPSTATRALAQLTVALDAATTFEEFHGIEQQAEALRTMVKAVKLGTEWQNSFYVPMVRALSKIGEILDAMEKNVGGRPTKSGESIGRVTLPEMGISLNYSSEAQKLARIPQEVKASYFALGETCDPDGNIPLLTKSGLFSYYAERFTAASQQEEPAPTEPETTEVVSEEKQSEEPTQPGTSTDDLAEVWVSRPLDDERFFITGGAARRDSMAAGRADCPIRPEPRSNFDMTDCCYWESGEIFRWDYSENAISDDDPYPRRIAGTPLPRDGGPIIVSDEKQSENEAAAAPVTEPLNTSILGVGTREDFAALGSNDPQKVASAASRLAEAITNQTHTTPTPPKPPAPPSAPPPPPAPPATVTPTPPKDPPAAETIVYLNPDAGAEHGDVEVWEPNPPTSPKWQVEAYDGRTDTYTCVGEWISEEAAEDHAEAIRELSVEERFSAKLQTEYYLSEWEDEELKNMIDDNDPDDVARAIIYLDTLNKLASPLMNKLLETYNWDNELRRQNDTIARLEPPIAELVKKATEETK
jgi:hypothetical protein